MLFLLLLTSISGEDDETFLEDESSNADAEENTNEDEEVPSIDDLEFEDAFDSDVPHFAAVKGNEEKESEPQKKKLVPNVMDPDG